MKLTTETSLYFFFFNETQHAVILFISMIDVIVHESKIFTAEKTINKGEKKES